jgi:O-antigen/teichoic acid export membrane protein
LGTSFFRALKWSMGAELASKAIQPLIFVVLARLLMPDDYGIMAAALMVISFTQAFWEAGMSKALIHRQQDVEESANTVFWINLVIGVTICVLLLLTSDLIAIKLFKDERVGDVLKVMTLQILFGSVGSVHTALLQKELKFDKLFWIRLTTVTVPGLFSIPLAWYGMSYWALIVGTLAGQAGQLVFLWKMHSWRPSLSFNTSLAKELGKYGSWVGVSGLLTWFYLWIDSLFVGAYLGTYELGLYRTGNQFVTMVYGFLFAPLLPVFFSHFSSLQNDEKKIQHIFFKITRIIIITSVPLAFVMFALAQPISLYVFGEKWAGVDFVLRVMALTQGFAWIVGVNGELYKAIGKPGYEIAVNGPLFAIYLIGYYISIQAGFESFVWGRFILTMIGVTYQLIFCWRVVGYPIVAALRLILMAVLIGMIAPVLKMLFANVVVHPLGLAVCVSIASLVLMGGLIYLLEKNGVIRDVSAILAKRND